jgi:hypothetical protein
MGARDGVTVGRPVPAVDPYCNGATLHPGQRKAIKRRFDKGAVEGLASELRNANRRRPVVGLI